MKKNHCVFKHSILSVGCAVATALLSSCYSSTVSVGEMKPTDPAVCVGTAHDAHFINGLIGSPKRDAKKYVGENKDYRIKQYQSFVDGLLSSITAGIYTPTTTKFYLPYGVAAPKHVRTSPPVKFGIRGGLNFSSLAGDYAFDDAKMKTGFNAGFILDIPFSKMFYFQPGVYYSVQGAKNVIDNEHRYYRNYDDALPTTDVTFQLIEVPLLFSYRYNLMNDLQLQGAVGPYVSFGINGSGARFNTVSRLIGAGGRFEAGVLYQKHYYAGIGYELAFKKMSTINAKPRNFFINIGYNF